VSEAEAQPRPTFTRLDVGMLIVLVSMAIAGVAGLIAVLDANNELSAVAVGFGVAWIIFLSGGTIACALACLARRRLEALSLGALVATGLAVDLTVLGIWFEIDSQSYGKLVGVAFIGALFGLIVLGLALSCRPRDSLARWLYLGAVAVSLLGATLAALLVVTTGSSDAAPELFTAPIPVDFENDGLLRPLAMTFVVLAPLWIAAVAASRVDRGVAD
jgi:hypothetical protein